MPYENYQTTTLIIFAFCSTVSLFFFSLRFQLDSKLVDLIYYSSSIIVVALVFSSSVEQRKTLFLLEGLREATQTETANRNALADWQNIDQDGYKFDILKRSLLTSIHTIEDAGFCDHPIPKYVDANRLKELGLVRRPSRTLVARNIWSAEPCKDLEITTSNIQAVSNWTELVAVWLRLESRAAIELSWPTSKNRIPTSLTILSQKPILKTSVEAALNTEISNWAAEQEMLDTILNETIDPNSIMNIRGKEFIANQWPFLAIILLQLKLCRRRGFIK